MKIAWVMGWAVAESWFAPLVRAALPADEHTFFTAAPDWLEKLRAAAPWDVVVGYSLGSLLLLQHADAVNALTPRVVLLAPVLAFSKEDGLGGKVGRTQVRFLARWLKTDRAAALDDFYTRAGLVGCESGAVTELAEVLGWGLERLAQDKFAASWPQGWRGYVGTEDAFLDAAELHRLYPALVSVTAANHHPAALVQAWAKELR